MIGDKIYKFRKSRNLSQEEFANSIGVTRQIVSKWESNQSVPLLDKLKKISDVYGIPYDELLKDTDYEYKKKNNIKKYIFLIILMIIVQILFIIIVSKISNRKMESNYKCLGSKTYYVLDIYDSDDNNYSYITLKNNNQVKTIMVSKLISSLVVKENMYEFIFRINEDNDDIEYIFNNGEIINVIETNEDVNIIDCKK